MMLVLSILFAIIPLLGIVWTIMSGSITTVDGLFMSLILLTLSGILLLNALLEARARGYLEFLHKKKAAAAPAAKAPAPATAAAKNTAPPPAQTVAASAPPAPKTTEAPQPQKTS
jgi:hypothetical protein